MMHQYPIYITIVPSSLSEILNSLFLRPPSIGLRKLPQRGPACIRGAKLFRQAHDYFPPSRCSSSRTKPHSSTLLDGSSIIIIIIIIKVMMAATTLKNRTHQPSSPPHPQPGPPHIPVAFSVPDPSTTGYKLNHIALQVSSAATALAFYSDFLGMQLAFALNAGPFSA